MTSSRESGTSGLFVALLVISKWMLEAGEYTMKRFAALYGMAYSGMVTSKADAAKLSKEV